MAKKRIAFVCQRYGTDVNGGSEQYCRQIAEKLSSDYDVTVYTTCAEDYITWENYYLPGTESIYGVTVKRFPVARKRNRYISALGARMLYFFPHHPENFAWFWMDLQGPYCPALISNLKEEANQYLTIFFMTYLYYTTAEGLMLDLPNAILIPTLHDEPPVWFRCYDSAFNKAKGFVWLTPEERAFAYKRFPQIRDKKNVLTGIGVEETEGEISDALLPEIIRNKHYLLYVGRIAKSKGCDELIAFFKKYKADHPGDLRLVLIGRSVMTIPDDPDIDSLGYVPDDTKKAIMSNAEALVLHSRYESLSMVVLESMMLGRPVLVTGNCEVLKGHCERSRAGLFFHDYGEYEKALTVLLNNPMEYTKMQKNGKKYVRENYRWDVILSKYKQMIETT